MSHGILHDPARDAVAPPDASDDRIVEFVAADPLPESLTVVTSTPSVCDRFEGSAREPTTINPHAIL